MKCEKCGKEFPTKAMVDGKRRNLQNRKFCLECSPFGQHNTSSLMISSEEKIKRRREQTVKAVTKRRKTLIQRAIEYKGGKCQRCGYNKCMRALEFHHRNPEEKEFGISDGCTKSWEKIKAEADKCDLLCSNCHREVEEELYNMDL